MKLKIGISLPQLGKLASPEAIVQVAERAEQMGLASLWVLDRLLLPTNPMDPWPAKSFQGAWPEAYCITYDPIQTLTIAATKTDSIALGTGILDALYLPPIVLGRMLATLDVITKGRLIVGLAQGWSRDEFKAVGVPPSRRGKGFEEYIRALRAIWGPDPVSFSGRYYSIPEARVGPKPYRSCGPPILLGGNSLAAYERAGRIGDGLILGLSSIPTWEMLNDVVNSFRSAAAAAGRSPEKLLIVGKVDKVISNDRIAGQRPPMSGDLAQIAEDVLKLEAIGFNHLYFNMHFAQIAIEEQLQILESLKSILN